MTIHPLVRALARGSSAAIMFLCGCGHPEIATPVPSAPLGPVPERVQVLGGKLQMGTKLGTLRASVTVGDFAIGKRPVSVAAYQGCVAAGACTAPAASWQSCQSKPSGVDGPTYAPETLGATSLPVTCVTPEQAAGYCSWVGGKLPRLEQFEFAARGPDVKRFAWGNDTPTCERVWRLSFDTSDTAACCSSDCSALTAPVLQDLPKGVAASGLGAVLATRGEIVAFATVPGVNACGPSGRACVITGQLPGAMDIVVPVPQDPHADAAALYLPPAGFRCAWEVAP